MYSSPTAELDEIRMGLFDTSDNTAYTYSDGALTVVGQSQTGHSSYEVLVERESKSQAVLDVAVTAPDKPKFLYTQFTNEADVNDSVYYLYNAGKTTKVCDGGKELFCGSTPHSYQLGASFVGDDGIVVARNADGIDYIELYSYDGTKVTGEKTGDNALYRHTVSGTVRAARPIVSPDGNAILWHVGNYISQASHNTSAVLYLMEGRPAVPQN